MKRSLQKNQVEQVIDALMKARKDKGLSHVELAKVTGLHHSSISLIESKKRQPTLLTCMRIAAALECDLGKLISETQTATR